MEQMAVRAGFPCQPFSNMSNQPGFNCEKGRGLLFQQIVRVLDISKPKAFLFENVPGLRDMDETFQHILGSFQASGYQVFTEVCSSRGLTTTSRKRLFFFGFRNDLDVGTFEMSFVPDFNSRRRTYWIMIHYLRMTLRFSVCPMIRCID